MRRRTQQLLQIRSGGGKNGVDRLADETFQEAATHPIRRTCASENADPPATGRLGRSPNVRAGAVRQSRRESIPVDPTRHHEQRMVVVEQLLEPRLKQIQLAGDRSRFGLHA